MACCLTNQEVCNEFNLRTVDLWLCSTSLMISLTYLSCVSYWFSSDWWQFLIHRRLVFDWRKYDLIIFEWMKQNGIGIFYLQSCKLHKYHFFHNIRNQQFLSQKVTATLCYYSFLIHCIHYLRTFGFSPALPMSLVKSALPSLEEATYWCLLERIDSNLYSIVQCLH